jgi:hypothetical protein
VPSPSPHSQSFTVLACISLRNQLLTVGFGFYFTNTSGLFNVYSIARTMH